MIMIMTYINIDYNSIIPLVTKQCIMVVMFLFQDNVRGALGTLLSLFICLGYLMVYCIGPYVSYEVQIYCSLVAPVVFIIVFTFLPESPYYLLQKDKKSEALASLVWLRKGRTPDDIEKELNMMQVISCLQIIILIPS